jgi:DNA-binding XRE family transcriptional regulator
MTQADLARAVDLDPTFVAKLETGAKVAKSSV